MKKINKKLQLKKENISQLQPDFMAQINGGEDTAVAPLTSIISCETNMRTCGGNCCKHADTKIDSDCMTATCPTSN